MNQQTNPISTNTSQIFNAAQAVSYQQHVYSDTELEEQLSRMFYYFRHFETLWESSHKLRTKKDKEIKNIKNNNQKNEHFEVIVFEDGKKPQKNKAHSEGRINLFTTQDPFNSNISPHLKLYISPFPFDTSESFVQQINHDRTDLLLSTQTDPTDKQPLIWISDKIALRPKKPITVSMDEYVNQSPEILKELEYKTYLASLQNKGKKITQSSVQSEISENYAKMILKERLHPIESAFALAIESLAQTCHKFMVNKFGIKDNLVSCESCFQQLFDLGVINTKSQLKTLIEFAHLRNKISHPGEHNFSAIELNNKTKDRLFAITTDILAHLDKPKNDKEISLTEKIRTHLKTDRRNILGGWGIKIHIPFGKQKKENKKHYHDKMKEDFRYCVDNIPKKPTFLNIQQLASYLDILSGLGTLLKEQRIRNGIEKDKKHPPFMVIKRAGILNKLAVLIQKSDPKYAKKSEEAIIQEILKQFDEARIFRNNFSHGKLTAQELKDFDIKNAEHLNKIKPIFQFIVSTFIKDHFDLWKKFLTKPVNPCDHQGNPIVRMPQTCSPLTTYSYFAGNKKQNNTESVFIDKENLSSLSKFAILSQLTKHQEKESNTTNLDTSSLPVSYSFKPTKVENSSSEETLNENKVVSGKEHTTEQTIASSKEMLHKFIAAIKSVQFFFSEEGSSNPPAKKQQETDKKNSILKKKIQNNINENN